MEINTTDPILSAPGSGPTTGGSSPVQVPWISIAWFSAFLLLSYFAVIRYLAVQWSVDEDVSHGFFVPLVAGYVAFQRRDELFSAEWKPNYLGALVVIWGAVQLLLGTLGAELFLQRTSLVITIAGAVLLMGGWKVLKIAAFPICLLLFMIPLPKVIYGQLTLPLQLFASQVAEHVLLALNIPVMRDGNVIELAEVKLSVVEACSGIRSLLSLSFISLVYGYFFEKSTPIRIALFISTIPIAIFANALRVTLTGIISEYDPALAQGFLHSVEGWVVFVVALTLLLATHKVLTWIASRGKAAAA